MGRPFGERLHYEARHRWLTSEHQYSYVGPSRQRCGISPFGYMCKSHFS